MPACTGCARADAIDTCNGCRYATYCGAACQRAHWAAHRPVCKAVEKYAAREGDWKPTHCDSCLAPLNGIDERCTGCFSVSFCNVACQLAHWKREHGDVCQTVGKARFARATERAIAGDAGAMFNVGLAYMNGSGVAVDIPASRMWYRRAAQAGNINAQDILFNDHERVTSAVFHTMLAYILQAMERSSPAGILIELH
jgi:hypothetical protein